MRSLVYRQISHRRERIELRGQKTNTFIAKIFNYLLTKGDEDLK